MNGELILYTTEDGQTRIQLRAEGGTVWLTQLEIAELFQTTKQNVSLHVINVLEERELAEEATVKEDLTVQREGDRQVRRLSKLHSLEMILAVGFRVRSHRGTQFRQWAMTHLREFLVKGFASFKPFADSRDRMIEVFPRPRISAARDSPKNSRRGFPRPVIRRKTPVAVFRGP